MKHIKLFEDYSDEELEDLIGDLRGIGHSDLKFDVTCAPRYEIDLSYEKEFAENYRDGAVFITSVEGSLGENHRTVDFDIELSNGSKISLVISPALGILDELYFRGHGLNIQENQIQNFYRNTNSNEPYLSRVMDLYNQLRKKFKV